MMQTSIRLGLGSVAILISLIAGLTFALEAQAQELTPEQRAGMLQQWLKASQAQLRSYEWIETTVVSQGGEEKKRSQNRCYYGADGNLQKISLQPNQTEKSGMPGILPLGRLLKKAAEHEKEEMVAYIQSTVELLHDYIPPDHSRIQQVISTGKLGLQVLEPGRRVQLNFADYLKAGDTLNVEIEMPTNRLLGVAVSSYLDSVEDPISLNVTMSVLPDGTIYSERSVMEASAKDIHVMIKNSGYRRVGQ